MAENADARQTPDAQGAEGTSGVAYDEQRLGEPGQPGVPTGDQYPTNEPGGGEEAITADVTIPGPYPSATGDPDAEYPGSDEPEPTKQSREAGSLGDLTAQRSQGTIRDETGGLGSPIFDEETKEG